MYRRSGQPNNIKWIIIILVLIAFLANPIKAILFIGLPVLAIGVICYILSKKEKEKNEEIRKQRTLEQERRNRLIEISDIDNMSGHNFEKYIAKLLDKRGFKTLVTKGSGDHGVDIVAALGDIKYAIQVKRHIGNISRRAVSDAVAGIKAYSCNSAMVVTNSYFSKGAQELAKKTGCTLIDRDVLVDWIKDYQEE